MRIALWSLTAPIDLTDYDQNTPSQHRQQHTCVLHQLRCLPLSHPMLRCVQELLRLMSLLFPADLERNFPSTTLHPQYLMHKHAQCPHQLMPPRTMWECPTLLLVCSAQTDPSCHCLIDSHCSDPSNEPSCWTAQHTYSNHLQRVVSLCRPQQPAQGPAD